MKYEVSPSLNGDAKAGKMYRIVPRAKSSDPKVWDLEAIAYLVARNQEDAIQNVARLYGAGMYVPVLLQRR